MPRSPTVEVNEKRAIMLNKINNDQKPFTLADRQSADSKNSKEEEEGVYSGDFNYENSEQTQSNDGTLPYIRSTKR